MKVMNALAEKIAARMRSTLGITAKITLVEPSSIERGAGKARRVIDKRKPQ
jgi:phenylacetate-CoA ligase